MSATAPLGLASAPEEACPPGEERLVVAEAGAEHVHEHGSAPFLLHPGEHPVVGLLREADREVVRMERARERPEQDELVDVRRMARREQKRHRTSLRHAEERGARRSPRRGSRRAGRPCSPRASADGRAVRQPLAALVVEHERAEARQTLEEAPHRRVLDPDLEVRDEAGDEDELDGPVADDAVGDADPARCPRSESRRPCADYRAGQRWSIGT